MNAPPINKTNKRMHIHARVLIKTPSLDIPMQVSTLNGMLVTTRSLET